MHKSFDKSGGFLGRERYRFQPRGTVKWFWSLMLEKGNGWAKNTQDTMARGAYKVTHPTWCYNTAKWANKLLQYKGPLREIPVVSFQLGISLFLFFPPWSFLHHTLSLLPLPGGPVLWDHLSVYSNGECFQVLLPAHYLTTQQASLSLTPVYTERLMAYENFDSSMGHKPMLNQSPPQKIRTRGTSWTSTVSGNEECLP